MHFELITDLFYEKGFEISLKLKKSQFTKFRVRSPVKYATDPVPRKVFPDCVSARVAPHTLGFINLSFICSR